MEVGKKITIIIKIIYLIIFISLVLLIINKFNVKRERLSSSHNLIKVEEIDKVNVAKITWNGIAKYYKDNSSDVDTYIKYEAEVIATMDMENFNKNITIDENKKTIEIVLPEIKLRPNVLFKDGGKSFSFIPQDTDIEMRTLVDVCEKDVIEKISKKEDMLKVARDNAKTTIEGLLFPLIDLNEYQILWKDGEING